MEKRLTEAFEQVTMPDACVKKIEARLKKQPETSPRYFAEPVRESCWNWLAPVAAVLALVTVLGLAGIGLPHKDRQLATVPTETVLTTVPTEYYHFRDSGTTFGEGVNANGDMVSYGESDTGAVPTWLRETDGRLFFVGNGENIDITDEISTEHAFVYSYTDAEGIRRCIAVGRLDDDPYVSIVDSVGWAVWYRNMHETVEGQPFTGWIGGTSHGHWCNALDAEYAWHEEAQRLLDIPWS